MSWKSVLFTLFSLSVITTPSGAAFAQEQKSEVNVEGIAAITNSTNSLILPYSATAGGGFLAGYRYHLSPRFALEGDYALTRNTQNLFNVLNFNTGLGVETNVHELTGAAVFTPGSSRRVRPYLLAGGGALFFRPSNSAVNTLLGIGNSLGINVNETRPAFLYGGGVDFGLTRSLALRAEYRGLVFRAPGLNLSGFNIPGLPSLGLGSPSFTHMAQPAIGLVWRF